MHTYTAIKNMFLAFVFLASPLASAIPITFNFTGTISDYILSNGTVQKSYAIIPKWIGKEVSGSLILDVDGISPTHDNASQRYYTSWDNSDYAYWMTFIINNPDGTSYTIAPPPGSLPPVDVDSASTYLTYREDYNDAQFFAGRNYANLKKKSPNQTMNLWLWARGENAEKLLNTTHFDKVDIKSEFANWENYGYVYYVKDNGKKMSYTFSIDSFTRVTSEVPEPGSWFLILLGGCGLVLNRYKKLNY